MLKTPILNNQLKFLKYNNSFWTTARMNIVSMETILDTGIVLLLVLYIMVQQ